MGVPEVPASLRSWMSAVSEIVRAVNAAEPLGDVLTRVAVRACELIGFEFCAVMLADDRRECLHVAGCSGLTPDYLAQVSDGRSLQIHPPGAALDTPAARAYREDRTIVVPDVRQAPYYGRLRHLAPTQGYRALLASPLRGSGDLAGVIVAYSVAAREFSGPELELIELLGGQAALALETSRRRGEQQDVIRELSRANDELRRGRAVLEWAEQLVIALLMVQQRHLLDVQSRLSGDLLGDLLRDGGPVRPRAVLDRATAIGHDLSRPHVVALLAVDGPVPSRVRLPELARAAAEPGPRPLVGPYDGLYVLLLPAEPDPGEALRRILAKAGQAVGARGTVTLVAGPVAHDPAGYATAFRVARGAAALRRASEQGGFVDVRRLGLSALLLETGAPDALRRFTATVLQRVEAHEERHGGDLLATLRAWLSAGCSTAAAAEALVVHRNTVTYRLGRVEQLTGRSLRENSVRLEFQLALTIREILTRT
jgi:sugar diacid utilization regulator